MLTIVPQFSTLQEASHRLDIMSYHSEQWWYEQAFTIIKKTQLSYMDNMQILQIAVQYRPYLGETASYSVTV